MIKSFAERMAEGNLSDIACYSAQDVGAAIYEAAHLAREDTSEEDALAGRITDAILRNDAHGIAADQSLRFLLSAVQCHLAVCCKPVASHAGAMSL